MTSLNKCILQVNLGLQFREIENRAISNSGHFRAYADNFLHNGKATYLEIENFGSKRFHVKEVHTYPQEYPQHLIGLNSPEAWIVVGWCGGRVASFDSLNDVFGFIQTEYNIICILENLDSGNTIYS